MTAHATKDINDIYQAVVGGGELSKVASDIAAGNDVDDRLDFEFNEQFFTDVESDSPEAVEKLANFIGAARENGHSDDEIDEILFGLEKEARDPGNAGDANFEPDLEDDEHEEKLAEAYVDGCEKAIERFLSEPAIKQAGFTLESLAEFEVGEARGFGYAETWRQLSEISEKVASATAPGPEDAAAAISQLEAQGFDVSMLRKQAGIEPLSFADKARQIMGKEASAESQEVADALRILEGHGWSVES